MKPKLIVLGTAAVLACGFSTLRAQDAPKPPPPGEGGQPPGGQGGPGADPKARFEEMFKKMDANGDGKISKEEFVEFSKKEAEERFKALDPEGTGSVDKAKMEEAFQRLRARGQGGNRGGQEGMRRPEGAAGGDGFRRGEGGSRPRPGAESSSGGTGAPPSGGQGGPGQGAPGQGGGGRGFGGAGGLGEMYRIVQEKGEISKEEFSKISDEQFKRLDTNGDGKITKEELEESMRKLREQFGRGRGGDGQGRPPGGDAGARPRPEGDAGGAPKRPESN